MKKPCLAVIGHPIDHSLSPKIQNEFLEKLSATDSSFKDWTYFKFDIRPEELQRAIPLFIEQDFRGLNITAPHKVSVVPLCKELSPLAKKIGAVNTLELMEGGWRGHNTDGFGLDYACFEGLQFHIKEFKTIAILGAGGAARAAAFRALEQGCKDLWLSNRTPEKAESLKADLLPAACGSINTFNASEKDWRDYDLPLVVNCTTEFEVSPFDVRLLPERSYVFDMAYRDGRKSSLASACAKSGIKFSNGLAMLYWQAAKSFQIWTGSQSALIERDQYARSAQIPEFDLDGDCIDYEKHDYFE